MLSINEAYGNKAILKLFPKPDYLDISNDVVVGDAQWISFDDIYIDDDLGNIARADGQDPAHVQDLRDSFSTGVLVNEELPAVIKNPEGSPTPWKLGYGYGRTAALLELGMKGWAFNTLEGTQTGIEDVLSYENEPKAPKKTNQEKDIIRLKSIQVKQGRISNDEDEIMKNLQRNFLRSLAARSLAFAAALIATSHRCCMALNASPCAAVRLPVIPKSFIAASAICKAA